LANAGFLLAVEGANETDNWTVTWNGVVGGGNSWMPVAQMQAALYAAVKADSVLKNYPVFSSSHPGGEVDNVGVQFLTIPAGAGALMPDGTVYADFANMHNYVACDGSGCFTMLDNLGWDAASPINTNLPGESHYQLQQDFGHTWYSTNGNGGYAGYTPAQLLPLPRVTTETGWQSQYGGTDAQGKILSWVYLAQYKRGYTHTFIYQLKDNEGGFANTFGVFDTGDNPKLGATYIHNLTAILNDNAAVSSTPGSLNYTIPNEPGTVHDLLMQKSTGAFELAVWDERPTGEATDNLTVNRADLIGPSTSMTSRLAPRRSKPYPTSAQCL
jgi:hypothetical protein